MNLMRLAIFLIVSTLCVGVQAQQRASSEEMLRDMELAKRADLMRVLDSAVMMMELGEYSAADEKMVHVLNNLKAIPSDFCFYFGKNSFHIGKYRQSADWLNKYIQLKGTSGQYYTETIKWLDEAEKKILELRKQEIVQANEILSRSFDIDCGPSGKVICPICKGATVIIKKGLLEDEYKNCTYCDKHGSMNCDDYNRLLRGELNSKK